MPQQLDQTLTQISWTAVSAASGDLTGYNVYRGDPGNEQWVGGVGPLNTSFFDYGTPAGDVAVFTPLVDSTGGVKAKYVIRFQDRLILAGIPGKPTLILISGRWPDQERFDLYAGGGELEVEPDSGENITGLGIHRERLVAFKENSVWEIALDSVTFGAYFILNPKYRLLTASQGCSSHRSIVPMENDLAFSNRQGVYILRFEPQLLNVLNANEISVKVQPYFEGLTDADLTSANGAYIDKKYVLSFPNRKETLVFDRERLSFTGPWPTPFGIRQWTDYVDENGIRRWIVSDADDAFITEFSEDVVDDKGIAIQTIFKTKKEDFGDWTIFKTINEIYVNFRAVTGTVSVNIYIENRSGNTVTAKSFTVTSSASASTSGFGTDQFGLIPFGLTTEQAQANVDELPKKAFIYKSSRLFQIEVRTTGLTDAYELLNILATGIPQARGSSPQSWAVT